MTPAELKDALSNKGAVEVDAHVTVTVNGVMYVWDKDTALKIADGIMKVFKTTVITSPYTSPTPFVPGLKQIPDIVYPQTGFPGDVVIPAKVTYGTDSTGSVGSQADQVCAAENKKYKERTKGSQIDLETSFAP